MGGESSSIRRSIVQPRCRRRKEKPPPLQSRRKQFLLKKPKSWTLKPWPAMLKPLVKRMSRSWPRSLRETPPRRNKKNKRKMGKEKTGLTFNPYQIRQLMKKGKYAKYIRPGAAIYMAAVLEYLVAEITEIAGNCARDNKKKRIIPRHIALAIKMDEECNQLLKGVIMPQGGVLPFIHKCL